MITKLCMKIQKYCCVLCLPYDPIDLQMHIHEIVFYCIFLHQFQLDTEEITLENAITKSFEKIVKLHLDPVWHQLGAKTKQLIADIKMLKLVLE